MTWKAMDTAPDDGTHIQVRTIAPHRDEAEVPWLVRWGGWRNADDLHWINVDAPTVANNPKLIEWNSEWCPVGSQHKRLRIGAGGLSVNEVWTWWCFESIGGKTPKKTICLHVQRGHEEFEARYDIALDYYHDNIRRVELPKRRRDIIDVMFPETMETWPKLKRFVDEVSDYARETYGLSMYARSHRLSRPPSDQETTSTS